MIDRTFALGFGQLLHFERTCSAPDACGVTEIATLLCEGAAHGTAQRSGKKGVTERFSEWVSGSSSVEN